jgi:hypothetical protein
MAAALQQSNMPSRQEVATLAGRFTNIEMRLDDMEAKLDRIVELCSAAKPAPASASHANTEAKAKTQQGSSGKRRSPQRGSSRKG